MISLNESHLELKTAVANNGLVIFAGAGISKSVGLPLWDELILKIILHINNNNSDHGNTLMTMFNNQASNRKIFDCLNYIENHNLKTYVNHVLNTEIYGAGQNLIDTNSPLPLHSKLWQLSDRIITPNYDILFESCSEFKNFKHPPISNKSILSLSEISKYSHYLLKIHGNISEINDIIFYESQYINQYNNNTAIIEKFKELISNHPILFVGTSMTDPFLNQIIRQVNSIFHGTSAKNFILSNEEFETADIIKIKGDPINELNYLIDELIKFKGKKLKSPSQNSEQLPQRIKTLKSAVDNLHDSSVLFPSYEDFEKGNVQLNEQLFTYTLNRFENKLGPLLCQGRWSTGKTVSTLRIGFELIKKGFTAYYLDLAYDIAGQEENIIKDFLHKILMKFNADSTVFIIDNVHLFPEHTFKISQWAIKEKSNCIFVGRPLSQEFKENFFYYPILFEQQEIIAEEEIQSTEQEEQTETKAKEFFSPKIIFKPQVEYVKSIFENKITSLGRRDIIKNTDIEKFAELISFNLTFIAFHVRNISTKTANIYEINYKLLYDYINTEFHLSEFPDEIFTIASLSFLDCKTDCSAIFLTDRERQNAFIDKQEHLIERRNFIYRMQSATGRLILDLGINQGLIRMADNKICHNFDSALKFFLEKYLINKPINIYEVFFGLSNYEYEANENTDDKVLEEARELIYYLLSNPKLNSHYADIIVHRTYSLLYFGFFVKTFFKNKVELSVLHTVINEETISKLAATYIEYRKKRYGENFLLSWHFKYAWGVLRKVDKNLAEFFLTQFPTESIIDYASFSVKSFSSILDMVIHHNSIDELVYVNRNRLIGDEELFKRKFYSSSELTIFFFMRTVFKLSLCNKKNRNLLYIIRTFISPEEYRDFVKLLPNITLLSFITARRVLGRDYSEILQKSFDKEFIYRLCYNKPLYKINHVISESGWKKFLRTDFTKKIIESQIDEVATFIRNIALHGSLDVFIDELANTLFKNDTMELIVDKLLSSEIESVFSFFWQLKTLDIKLFNEYFNYYFKTENEFKALQIEKTKTAFSFLFLIYCYSYDLNSKSFLKQSEINIHIRKVILSDAFVDKMFLSATSVIFNIEMKIPYSGPTERIRGIHYTETLFQTLDAERNRFDVYDSLMFYWEGKILLFSASLIGINKIDESILKDSRFNEDIKNYLNDLKLILNNLENRLEDYCSRNSAESLLLNNRVSILKLAMSIFI